MVLKPANRQASVGVQLLDRVDSAVAETAWARTTAASEYEQIPDRPLNWRYVVEERLVGPEYSVEALVRDGEVVFENVSAKTVVDGPYPIELGHLVPAPLDAGITAHFAAALRALVRATGFGTGILHAEWILTGAGPTLVECAGRCPGDHLVDLIDLAYDGKVRLSLIDLLAGRPAALPARAVQAAAIRFLTAEPGTVTGVSGVDTARQLPGVRDVAVDVEPGSTVGAWTSSWDRPGHVLVTGADPEGARHNALTAAATVRIDTTSGGAGHAD
ncbi:hypothetical protein Psuf_005340 [Phytohabitans suffuscus]|uniref:L-amino acid ligase C-terminal domain-containing protein n=1 Tax=Phytohabitans suffuscus TaxID=624315 RepID=A0A6F8YB85_9ACTN|nr:ATP-grasp domain-containing protein [Phytohabitans suffuscus]BCB83221.1 hypothetical protein Psuf_005340 [Phytohabitans suffuscus]